MPSHWVHSSPGRMRWSLHSAPRPGDGQRCGVPPHLASPPRGVRGGLVSVNSVSSSGSGQFELSEPKGRAVTDQPIKDRAAYFRERAAEARAKAETIAGY